MTQKASSLDAILKPKSVAVIGASGRNGSIGREILKNLIQFGFEGPVFPINARSTHVLSLKAWSNVLSVPDPIDLAIIVVPQNKVLQVVKDCAQKGVKGLVIITAGFREVGEEGRKLEEAIGQVVRENTMRMIGPNCMGVINTATGIRLDASFGATLPLQGNAAFASQSGALGEVVLSTAKSVGLGISQFVSLGNKTDISGNDLLEWWATDPQTQVILLYLESFGNPKNFAQIAQQVTRTHGKPILAVKSGRTAEGALAASSHTGSLAGGDRAASSLLSRCGVIRCNTVSQLFDIARGFASQPLPLGKQIAILTNAGGPGIMATDAAVFFGLELAPLSESTQRALSDALPNEASVKNPVDMIASANAEQYERCAQLLLADPSVDALLCIFVSPVVIDPIAVARGIVRGTEGTTKPVLSCFMGREAGDQGVAILQEAGIPNYPFPEPAAQTLAKMAAFQAWRAQPEGVTRHFDIPPFDRKKLTGSLSADGWLSAQGALELLAHYRIPIVPSQSVTSPDEAVAFAQKVGFPIVLKLDSPDLLHKSDAGAVKLNLSSESEIKDAFWDLQRILESHQIDEGRYLVQKMASGRRETIVGAVQDATAGHLLMFGLGGIFVELMKDVSFGVHPLTDVEARRMVRSIKGWPLLQGYRGEEGVNTDLLEELLLRVDQLLGDLPEISELDINPFIATSEGGFAVDARVRVTMV